MQSSSPSLFSPVSVSAWFCYTVGAGAEVLSSFGRNAQSDPNAQLKIGGVGMTSVQGTGQTGVRTSAFKKGVLGNEKSATKFARPGMNAVNLSLIRACSGGGATV